MANTPVEVKKAAPASAPDPWRSFRTEMDRLFDRFAGGWGMPSLRRMFEAEPAMRYESSFTMPSPAVDITEDDSAYKVDPDPAGIGTYLVSAVLLALGIAIFLYILFGEARANREQEQDGLAAAETGAAPVLGSAARGRLLERRRRSLGARSSAIRA